MFHLTTLLPYPKILATNLNVFTRGGRENQDQVTRENEGSNPNSSERLEQMEGRSISFLHKLEIDNNNA